MNFAPYTMSEFLAWFQSRTEQAWAHYSTVDFKSARRAGVDWTQGTRWLGGLSSEQINQVERHWSISFPPDYQLFLRHLHAVDRPMVEAVFRNREIVLRESPAFYNWLTDRLILEAAFEAPLSGLLFDVEYNNLWQSEWGEMPQDVSARKAAIQAKVQAAPKLIPVFGHRYLVAGNNGNPVLSIQQSDCIVYGNDLREYLLHEFADLLNLRGHGAEQIMVPSPYSPAAIPFWGALIRRSQPNRR